MERIASILEQRQARDKGSNAERGTSHGRPTRAGWLCDLLLVVIVVVIVIVVIIMIIVV